jgi:hypothetical protein
LADSLLKAEHQGITMTKPNSKPNNEIRELSIDEMDLVSGGAIETREIVVKAVVGESPTPPPTAPAPTPIPLPNLKIRF